MHIPDQCRHVHSPVCALRASTQTRTWELGIPGAQDDSVLQTRACKRNVSQEITPTSSKTDFLFHTGNIVRNPGYVDFPGGMSPVPACKRHGLAECGALSQAPGAPFGAVDRLLDLGWSGSSGSLSTDAHCPRGCVLGAEGEASFAVGWATTCRPWGEPRLLLLVTASRMLFPSPDD